MGAGGQLGAAVVHECAGAHDTAALTRRQLDVRDAEAVEARYRDHQRALSLFLERQVTAGLIVARQAARSLAAGGFFTVSRRRPRTPEAVLASEAQRQIVRTAAEEFRLLGIDAGAAFTHGVPALSPRLAALEAASA